MLVHHRCTAPSFAPSPTPFLLAAMEVVTSKREIKVESRVSAGQAAVKKAVRSLIFWLSWKKKCLYCSFLQLLVLDKHVSSVALIVLEAMCHIFGSKSKILFCFTTKNTNCSDISRLKKTFLMLRPLACFA